MTATTQPRKVGMADANPRQWPVAPLTLIKEGWVIGRYPSGVNQGTVTTIDVDPSLVCEGISRHTVDNSANNTPSSAAGLADLYVDELVYPLFASGLDETAEGQAAYGVDNQTFSLSSLGGTLPLIGLVWEVTSATTAYVKVGRAGIALARSVLASQGQVLSSVALADASATVQIGAGDWRLLPAATLTQSRTLTIGTTGAKAGDRMLLTRLDLTGYAFTVVNGGVGAGTLAVMQPSRVSSLDLTFDGTNWGILGIGGMPGAPLTAGTALGDTSPTLVIGGGNWYTLPAATLTAARTVTLGTTGALVGDEITITRSDLTLYPLTITDGGSGTPVLGVLPPFAPSSIRARYDGTNWKVVALGTLGGDFAIGAALTNGDATVTRAARITWRSLPAATLTAAHALTIGTTGALVGNIVIITRLDLTANAYTITNGGVGAGNPAVMPGESIGFVVLYFDGTNWICLAAASIGGDVWAPGTALTDTATQTVQRAGRKTWSTIAGTLSQDSALTLGTTGALVGDLYRVSRTSTSAHTYAIVNGGAGAGTLFTMVNSKVNFADLYFDGTNWSYMAGGTQ